MGFSAAGNMLAQARRVRASTPTRCLQAEGAGRWPIPCMHATGACVAQLCSMHACMQQDSFPCPALLASSSTSSSQCWSQSLFVPSVPPFGLLQVQEVPVKPVVPHRPGRGLCLWLAEGGGGGRVVSCEPTCTGCSSPSSAVHQLGTQSVHQCMQKYWIHHHLLLFLPSSLHISLCVCVCVSCLSPTTTSTGG